MGNNNKFKETDTKNRTFYYFNDIIKIEDFDLDNISIDEKLYENILVYKILYKNLITSKPLHIRFHKIDGFVRVYNGIIFGSEKYDSICNRIRYLITVKCGIIYLISHNYAKIKVMNVFM